MDVNDAEPAPTRDVLGAASDTKTVDQALDARALSREHAAALERLAAAGGLADAFETDDPRPATAAGGPPSARPLTRDRALALLREHTPEMERRFGVRPVALFGSVARDEARPDSDVDVLVEYLRPPGLHEFMGAIEYLEAVFGTRVDLGTHGALKPRVAAYVDRDLVRVA